MRRTFPVLFVILFGFNLAWGAVPGGNYVRCEQRGRDLRFHDIEGFTSFADIRIQNPRATAYCLSGIPSSGPTLTESSLPNDPNLPDSTCQVTPSSTFPLTCGPHWRSRCFKPILQGRSRPPLYAQRPPAFR